MTEDSNVRVSSSNEAPAANEASQTRQRLKLVIFRVFFVVDYVKLVGSFLVVDFIVFLIKLGSLV